MILRTQRFIFFIIWELIIDKPSKNADPYKYTSKAGRCVVVAIVYIKNYFNKQYIIVKLLFIYYIELSVCHFTQNYNIIIITTFFFEHMLMLKNIFIYL